MTAGRNNTASIVIFPDPTPSRLGRLVAAGVAAYARANRRWLLRLGETDLRSLERRRPDGIICLVNHASLGESIRQSAESWGVPLVNALHPLSSPGLPQVVPDEEAVGKMAVRHLLDCGHRNLAFLGWRHMGWSRFRRKGFCDEAQAAGCEPICLDLDGRLRLLGSDRTVQNWLEQLPKPVGIFASHDFLGYSLAEACRQKGLLVPADVTLVAVDNDELWCELAATPLSSVIIPAERIGFQAGEVLGRLLDGRPAPQAPQLLAPTEVAQRASSDVFAHADAEVAAAIRYIRSSVNSGNSINVWDVLQQVPVSRRTLEKRFRSATGRTPLQEIQHLRIERAKTMLASSNQPIGKIAIQLGYRNANRLVDAFRKLTSQTPLQYRRRNRKD